MYVLKRLLNLNCILVCFPIFIAVLFPQFTFAQQFDNYNQANNPDTSNKSTEILQQYQRLKVLDLKSQLLQVDYDIALRALNDALNEVPDNVTYKWSRKGSDLQGRVRPTSVFRDNDGRLCRHIVYALSLGHYTKQIESIACRDLTGNWALSG